MQRFADLTGQRFGRLVVIKQEGSKLNSSNGHMRWLCKCDCGKEATVEGSQLRTGRSRSCGCLRKAAGDRTASHRETGTRLYAVWNSMKRRCNSPSTPAYEDYGGRGIKVCSVWDNSFPAFRDWALANGYNPNAKRGKCTLDRIDVNSNYCPDNCRWVSMQEQGENKRNNINIEVDGVIHTLTEWSRIMGISRFAIQYRIDHGWSARDAVLTPPKKGECGT